MSDLVGNPEDQFSHNEAQITQPIPSTKTLTVDRVLRFQRDNWANSEDPDQTASRCPREALRSGSALFAD